jgi:hypothetical protein
MDILLQFILYYAKFVPKQVLFVQPAPTQRADYSELKAEILTLPPDALIPEIENFVFSLNTKYLSDFIPLSLHNTFFISH